MSQLQFPGTEDPLATGVTWVPTREAGLARLSAFVPRSGRAYGASRNTDLGPDNRGNISCLSPWLRHRLVLEEEVVSATLTQHSLSGAEKFIQEVFWRAYFKGWLEQRPHVWQGYNRALVEHTGLLDRDEAVARDYSAAIAGTTGIDCFDAWVGELVTTGYLHNHARMWFASIWIFTLRLPWELGADFFYRHLLDGDPASNTLSWRWVGGLHTRGKTYLARTSNISKFTDGRFGSDEALSRQLARIAKPLHGNDNGEVRPVPQEEHATPGAAFGLLVTVEDCCPETLVTTDGLRGVLGAHGTKARSLLDVGTLPHRFADGAISNALMRVSNDGEYPTRQVSELPDADALVTWAENIGVRDIIMAYPPVGPVADHLAQIQPGLECEGLRLVRMSRAYDRTAWPHATKGFFGLKKKIPQICGSIGLAID